MGGTADIGLIGLGVMGSNLALNIAGKGHRIAVFNRTTEKTRQFAAQAGPLAANIVACETMLEFTAAIRPPRPVIIMTLAGPPVDQQIAMLRGFLSAGDIIIDAGNADFRDTIRRGSELAGSGLDLVGMGVSGGEDGARHGPSIMVGGERASYDRIEPILEAIAARYEGEPCCAWMGPGGAGHFVKTVHNGIEYADMQMIAEIYGLMRDRHAMSPADMADVFARWNEGVLDSYLIETTARVLRAVDPDTGRPMVDIILDRAGQKGTGRWAAIEAQMLGIPATVIETAVAARNLSAMKELRARAESAYGRAAAAPERADAARLAMLESGLFAGKIAAYAQGFHVIAAASREFEWNTPLDAVARIWRAGCIIRSAFLDRIATAFQQSDGLENLLLAPQFVTLIGPAAPSLRRIVADAALAGVPVPALSAAIAYFDGVRLGRGTANLIQAQRDFFGAHGFERIDRPGMVHRSWLTS